MKHLFMILFLLFLLSYSEKKVFCSNTKSLTNTNSNSQSKSQSNTQSESSTEISSNIKFNTNFKTKTNSDFRYKANLNTVLRSNQPAYILGKDPKYQESYWEGWISYIHYDGPLKKIPKRLFKNTEYFHQRVAMSSIKKKDKHGSLMIPNKSKFYCVVNHNSLQIFTTRRLSYKHQWDSLELKYIKPIPEDNFMKGGLHNIFKPSKIGFCFDLKISIKSKRKSWLICLSDNKEKEKLMKVILRLKLKIQRKNGKFETGDSIKLKKKKAALSDRLKAKKKIDKTDLKRKKAGAPLDGHWVLIWDWSQCSLKCGGGESFQQWRCLPPKNGGKPCQGKAIRKKTCNNHPCPGLDSLRDLKKTKPQVLKPIIKVGTFSNRLQRYEKCVVKDNDAYSAKYNKKTRTMSKIPIRLVMNNNTITLYKDDNYQSVQHSFNLGETTFKLEKTHFCCFTLTDQSSENMVCGYDKFCGSTEGNEWAKGWNKDFGLFKNSCRTGRYTLLTHIDEENLKNALKKKLSGGKADLDRKKATAIKQQMLNNLNSKNNPIKKAHDEGFKALQKEMRLEKLIKQEEMEREKLELDSIASKIKTEEEKSDCLNRNIKEKKLDSEILNERKSAENEANQFKKDISKKVLNNRKNFKKMINTMRAKAALKRAALARQLQALRAKMAANIAKANKIGNIKKCIKGKSDKDYRSNYCDKVFIDDFVRNGDCKSDNFCYTCCENEFGNMHIDKREECYNMCDGTLKKKVVKSKKRTLPGVWNWQ